MKYKFLFLFLCFVFISFGQNWLPIDTAKDYNFTIGDGELIMRTISTEKSNDTIFFETVLDSCYSCSYSSYPDTFLLKQPDFLGFYMLNSFDTSYSFYGRDTFTIKTNASLGASWAYGSGRTATVIGEGVQSFDAQVDSIKTIWLGGGDTLVLAKEHGLVRFPCLWRNKLYQQIGIEEIYGAQDLSFWDIYNFEPGDILQYRYRRSVDNEVYLTFRKVEILFKEQGLDYLGYYVFVQSNYNQTALTPYMDTVIFNFKDLSNLRIGSGITDTVNLPFVNSYNKAYVSSFYSYDVDNSAVKTLESNPRYSSELLATYYVQELGDSLCVTDNIHFRFKAEYKAGLGQTSFQKWYLDSGNTNQLIGYYKGIDTVGTIYPDEFYVGINDGPNINEMIKFYPNPIQDNLWIEVFNNDELLIEFRNVFGQIIWSREIEESAQVDLSNLPKGIYFLQACTQGYSCASAKLIKN
ncbi:MAG: T9SS type A sorting domain-containing protein [Chitinophagales bacterium]|nr:T9SS type A sorting domain-containing protein [Chitinophagales bacterium]